MIEIVDRLWVGSKQDCPAAQLKDLQILHAAKTCHQGFLGYATKMDVHDPQYLVALTGRDLYLNLVDAPFEPSVALVESAIGWLMDHHRSLRQNVLVHCDQGESRAPALALLYLLRTEQWKNVDVFRMKYPSFKPRDGMIAMLRRYGVEP